MAGIKVDRSDRQPPDLLPLQELVAREPNDPSARRRLGWALFATGAFADSLTVFREAVRVFPDDLDLKYGLGLAAQKAESIDEADAAFLFVAERAESLSDTGRAEILHRLATGHHNRLRTGRWGLVREIWGGA
jgi:tetratricopeptide (TPR) repeat protein